MFTRGRLAMPHIRHENVRHATLLFCAEGVNVRTTGAGEKEEKMTIACSTSNWVSFVLPGLTLVFTLIGMIVAYHEARVTQKIALSNKRVTVYKLLCALTNALQRVYESALTTMPSAAVNVAVDWITELQKEIAIIDLCKKANIGSQSLNLLQLKDMIESDFSIARYVFFVEKSTRGVSLIVKELEKYGNAHNAYVQSTGNTSFTNKDLEMIRVSIDGARQSIASMDKEMTIRNIFNR